MWRDTAPIGRRGLIWRSAAGSARSPDHKPAPQSKLALMDPPAATTDAIRAVLDGTPGVVSAYLFGSVAEGRTHRQSDIDVAVLLDRSAYPRTRDRFDARLRLIGRLQAELRREVDLVILNDAPPQLGRHIISAGRPLFVSDREADHAYTRVTLSRAADLEPFLRRMRTIALKALAR